METDKEGRRRVRETGMEREGMETDRRERREGDR